MNMNKEENTQDPSVTAGALQASLDRNPKTIRKDRANQISKDARLRFRRKLEDKLMRLNELESNREALIDMSPNNADAIISATNFDGDAFTEKMSKIAMDIWKIQIEVDVLKREYKRLFGEDAVVAV